MDQDLEPIYQRIIEAKSAEELFGVTDVILPAEDLLQFLKKEYEKLKPITSQHWSNPEDADAAREIDQKLEELYVEAQKAIRDGLWNLGKPDHRINGPTFSTGKREYVLGEEITEGEISTVYIGACKLGNNQAGNVIIKVVNSPEDNDLARNEIRTLLGLHRTPAVQWKHLPFMMDNFETNGRLGIILRKFQGPTLKQIRNHRRYKNGLDQKHMVWILNRALSAIGFVHSQGYVHCNLNPDHLIVGPVDHNLCVLDWSYSAFKPAQTGEDFKFIDEIFSAPEVQDRKEKPHPAADIYSLGKTMIWLLGGNPETNQMPDEVEEDMQKFLLEFVLEDPFQRPYNAWDTHRKLILLVERLWGRRKYRRLEMD